MQGTRITMDRGGAEYIRATGDIVMDFEAFGRNDVYLKCSDGTIIRFQLDDPNRAIAFIVRQGRLVEEVTAPLHIMPPVDDVVVFKSGLIWVRETGTLAPSLPTLNGPLRVRVAGSGLDWVVSDNNDDDGMASFDHEAHAMLFAVSRNLLAAAEALIAAPMPSVDYTRALEDLKAVVFMARDC